MQLQILVFIRLHSRVARKRRSRESREDRQHEGDQRREIPRRRVARVRVVAGLHTSAQVLFVEVETTAVGHSNDLGVRCQGSAVQRAGPHHQGPTGFIVYAGNLETRGRWEEAVPAFPTPQAGRL